MSQTTSRSCRDISRWLILRIASSLNVTDISPLATGWPPLLKTSSQMTSQQTFRVQRSAWSLAAMFDISRPPFMFVSHVASQARSTRYGTEMHKKMRCKVGQCWVCIGIMFIHSFVYWVLDRLQRLSWCFWNVKKHSVFCVRPSLFGDIFERIRRIWRRFTSHKGRTLLSSRQGRHPVRLALTPG